MTDRIAQLEAALLAAQWELQQARERELEARVAEWVRTRIGAEHMHSRERAMRLLEEAVELAQAEGITEEMVSAQVDHVYWRPTGEPAQEAAGVAVCLLGWCAATGHRLIDLAIAEIERIEAKPLAAIRGSLARKADADLVTALHARGTPRAGAAEAQDETEGSRVGGRPQAGEATQQEAK